MISNTNDLNLSKNAVLSSVEQEPFFKESYPSVSTRRKNVALLILDYIRKNGRVSFPQVIKDLDLKRSTAADAVRDLEIARLVISYMALDDMHRAIKFLRISGGDVQHDPGNTQRANNQNSITKGDSDGSE